MTPKKSSSKILLGATALVLAAAAAGTALAERGDGPGGPGLQRLFEEIDADGDGAVTRAEANRFRETRFAGADADASGGLSLAEFQDLWVEMLRDRVADRFQRLDADGDGTVSPVEFERPLERMFGRLDENGDGAVTQAEIRDRHGWRGRHRD